MVYGLLFLPPGGGYSCVIAPSHYRSESDKDPFRLKRDVNANKDIR